jgi:hypothetical protein
MKFVNWFKKNNPAAHLLTLEECVEENLLTNEERLSIEKNRAIAAWEKEIFNLKKKPKK